MLSMGSHAEKQASCEASAAIQSHFVHEGKFISVRRDEIALEDGSSQTWDIIVHPGAVAIIPLTENGDLILVEQWRRAIGKITLEIPAGLLEKGETSEACAARELQEEIGFKPGKLLPLGIYYSSPGIFTEKVHLFLAKELIPSQLIADDTAAIDIHTVPISTALKWISDGIICDMKTALAILKVSSL